MGDKDDCNFVIQHQSRLCSGDETEDATTDVESNDAIEWQQNGEAVPDDPGCEELAVIDALFARYDWVGSGTINTMDELQQLTVNLVTRLQLSVAIEYLDSETQAAEQELPMSLEEYKAWWAGLPAVRRGVQYSCASFELGDQN